MVAIEERSSATGRPTWEVAHLFPNQGEWTVEDYLVLNTNHLVELSEGALEVLPMPTEQHQLIVLFLCRVLYAFAAPERLGTVLAAPLRVELWEGKFREPDVVFMLAENATRRGEKYWRGADLVMEVVSQDDPQRDLVNKRLEYERAGISEYWIINPLDQTVTVLARDPSSGRYTHETTYTSGDMAQSRLLEGFCVNVTEVFSQT